MAGLFGMDGSKFLSRGTRLPPTTIASHPNYSIDRGGGADAGPRPIRWAAIPTHPNYSIDRGAHPVDSWGRWIIDSWPTIPYLRWPMPGEKISVSRT
jgi:hypothetical protein